MLTSNLCPFSFLLASLATSIYIIRLCKEPALGVIDSQLIYIIFKAYSRIFSIFSFIGFTSSYQLFNKCLAH